MIILISAALAAAAPAAPAQPADAHAEHMAAMAGHAEHGDGKMMDCCKHCCDDMAKDRHGRGDPGKH